jgi:hypothetical protein
MMKASDVGSQANEGRTWENNRQRADTQAFNTGRPERISGDQRTEQRRPSREDRAEKTKQRGGTERWSRGELMTEQRAREEGRGDRAEGSAEGSAEATSRQAELVRNNPGYTTPGTVVALNVAVNR